MSMTDLEIVAQIEQELGVKLKPVKEIRWNTQGYVLNQEEQILGLGLHDCGIQDLQQIIVFLQNLSQLQSLDLSYNKISDYSFLQNLSQLQSLDLSGNKISDISFLQNLSQLQSLGLSGNKISDISFL
jgi:Leucine-rich repeat (LRR) protein